MDEAASDVLKRVLKELGIRVESCPDFPRAGIRANQERFDAVIVDGPSSKEVLSLLRETRMSRLNEQTLAVAVVPSQESIRELFSLGVNFVLYKPVAYERALSSLRAARAVMRKEKRKKDRAVVHTHATVDYAGVEQENATLVNLGENGMQVLFGKKIPPTNKVYFQFRLPGQSSSVRLSGQLVWQEWNGRAGVQFVDVPKSSRRLLDEFLASNLPTEESKREYLEPAVEIDEPLEVSVISREKPHASGSATMIEEEVAPAVTTTPTNVCDADNRRTQTRYTCRIGAEVYQTGSPVPNYCSLTDLSAGGCYLEVPLPFPQGTAVELVVRTYEMKLMLRGTVQTSHPGYGVGVVFELNTEEEQASVQKLTQYVASQQSGSN